MGELLRRPIGGNYHPGFPEESPMSDDKIAAIREALTTVLDPEIGQDLVTLDMIKEISVDGETARVTVELTTPGSASAQETRSRSRRATHRIDPR